MPIRLVRFEGQIITSGSGASAGMLRVFDLYDVKQRSLNQALAGECPGSLPLVYGNGGEAGFGPAYFGLSPQGGGSAA